MTNIAQLQAVIGFAQLSKVYLSKRWTSHVSHQVQSHLSPGSNRHLIPDTLRKLSEKVGSSFHQLGKASPRKVRAARLLWWYRNSLLGPVPSRGLLRRTWPVLGKAPRLQPLCNRGVELSTLMRLPCRLWCRRLSIHVCAKGARFSEPTPRAYLMGILGEASLTCVCESSFGQFWSWHHCLTPSGVIQGGFQLKCQAVLRQASENLPA